MDHQGFRLIREAFNQFVTKHKGDDITKRVVRSLATGGQAAVNKGLQEFPKSFVRQVVTDLYGVVTSAKTSQGISQIVQGLDEEKVKRAAENTAAWLQEDKNALKVARALKDGLSRTTADDIETMLDGALVSRDMTQQMIVKAFFMQIKPHINDMKDAPAEEIAEHVKNFAATIPSDALAQQVGAMTRRVTPERIASQSVQAMGALPTPGTIADIVHESGEAAAQKFARVATHGTVRQVQSLARDFVDDLRNIASRNLAKDQENKRKSKPQSGDFDL